MLSAVQLEIGAKRATKYLSPDKKQIHLTILENTSNQKLQMRNSSHVDPANPLGTALCRLQQRKSFEFFSKI
jgi:hypothetical protein